MKYDKKLIESKNWQMALVLTCVVLCGGCSQEIADDLFGGGTPVRISANFELPNTGQTRASSEINTAGFTVSSAPDCNRIYMNINNIDYTYTVSGTAGAISTTLNTTSQPYFPVGVNSVNVNGHYPYVTLSGGSADFTVKTDQTGTDNYLLSDLMAANRAQATRVLQNGAWAVTDAELNFRHLLTKIVINASSENSEVIKINSVKINNVRPTVTLTCTDGIYSIGEATGDRTNITVLNGAGQGAVIIPPQSFEGTAESPMSLVTINVDYQANANSPGETWNHADLQFLFTNTKQFLGNTVYTMNIVVGIDQITLNDGVVDISGWNTGDNIIWITPTVTTSGLASLGKIELSNSLNKIYTGNPLTLTTSNSETDNVEMKVWARSDLHTDQYTRFLRQSTDGGVTGDYILTYVNNIHADDTEPTATVKVIGINDFSGYIEAKFQIHSKSINDSHVTIDNVSDMVYDGGEKKPEVKIYDNESGTVQELHINTDYTLDYDEDVINCGQKSFVIKGIGNYNGTRTSVPTYNITKSPYGTCTFDVSGQTKRYYLVSGSTEYYTPTIASLEGDSQSDLTITMTSNNATIADAGGNGQVHIKKGGLNGAEAEATITIAITGKNYTYPNQTFTLKVKEGPRLPIMYVADTNMGTASTLAANNWSTSSAYFSWNSENYRGFDPTKIGSTYLTGYHIPALYEWYSIFPSGGIAYFTSQTAITDQSDENIQFGYNGSSCVSTSVSHANWKSDYYFPGGGVAYGLRFKGTSYCCAYRYEWLTTNDDNMWLTGNTFGKYSVVVRVIYLGSSYTFNGSTYSSVANLANISDEQWKNYYDYKIALPVCGGNHAGCAAGQFSHDRLPDYGHYMTTTTASGSNRYVLRISEACAELIDGGGTYGYSSGINIRPFKNAP